MRYIHNSSFCGSISQAAPVGHEGTAVPGIQKQGKKKGALKQQMEKEACLSDH